MNINEYDRKIDEQRQKSIGKYRKTDAKPRKMKKDNQKTDGQRQKVIKNIKNNGKWRKDVGTLLSKIMEN